MISRLVINQALSNVFRYIMIDVVYCGQYRRFKMSAVLELFVFVLRNANCYAVHQSFRSHFILKRYSLNMLALFTECYTCKGVLGQCFAFNTDNREQ